MITLPRKLTPCMSFLSDCQTRPGQSLLLCVHSGLVWGRHLIVVFHITLLFQSAVKTFLRAFKTSDIPPASIPFDDCQYLVL